MCAYIDLQNKAVSEKYFFYINRHDIYRTHKQAMGPGPLNSTPVLRAELPAPARRRSEEPDVEQLGSRRCTRGRG